MVLTKVIEIFSHEIIVPVGGMTLVVFFMVCDILTFFNVEHIGLGHVMLCFFGLFELVSLFENLGEIGVPLPSFIRKSLERLKVTLEGEE